MPDTIPVGKYYNFDNKNVDVVYNPDENKGDISSVLDDLIEGNKGVHLVSNAKSVRACAFYLCENLISIDFPKVTSIGNSAFNACTALISIDFPKVTSIGNSAFQGCTALTSINLPNVTSIGESAFKGISYTAIINIGAAEGEISGAPWGAPNGVTINYNVK